MQNENILEVHELSKYFPIEKGLFKKVVGFVRAVDKISVSIKRGEVLGVVGESGSGKTTLGKCILKATEITNGEILFRDDSEIIHNIPSLNKKDLRRLRKEINMIFQDPFSSLSPRMTVNQIISEPLFMHNYIKTDIQDRVKYLIQKVGLQISHLNRYPNSFSGGQRQRIGIARALATNPRLIVADEPVSALDVSIQAQILNLLQELKDELNLTYLFISHNLSVIEHISDRVAVMYVGRIVESGSTQQIYSNPQHPYTKALLSALPKPEPGSNFQPEILRGEVANPANPPSGCHFHPRCSQATEFCSKNKPELVDLGNNHYSACFFSK